MKVTISVGGRFHAFQLARELYKRDALCRLITSHPRFSAARFGVPRRLIRSVVIKEFLERGWQKLPAFLKAGYDPQYLIHSVYDTLARSKVIRSDIFVGWANYSLRSMRRAKALGAITVLERGSSHIEYQTRILKEERSLFGGTIELPHPKILEQELIEYAEADYISVPSQFAKKTFLDYGFPEWKILHAPYGANLSLFEREEKKDNVFRVICVGGMSLRKGVHYLLQAFRELHLNNAELLLIGRENDDIKPYFKKYAGTFRYLGPLSQREVAHHYSQSSVFVLASIEEGLALVQAEAMACGLPVICTTNTGGSDVVRDGVDGFIVQIRDVEALKTKILLLYEHEEIRARMADSAFERVRTGFTWHDYGNRVMKNYDHILSLSKT